MVNPDKENLKEWNVVSRKNGYPRIVGWINKLKWFEARRFKGKIKIFVSLFNGSFVRDIIKSPGKIYANKHNVSQFSIEITKKQARELIKVLQKKL